jgi:hypothetical protein
MKDLQPWEAVTTSDGKHGTIAGIWYNDAKQQIGYKVKFHNSQTRNVLFKDIATSARNTYASPEQLKKEAKLADDYRKLIVKVQGVMEMMQREAEICETYTGIAAEVGAKTCRKFSDMLNDILEGK